MGIVGHMANTCTKHSCPCRGGLCLLPKMDGSYVVCFLDKTLHLIGMWVTKYKPSKFLMVSRFTVLKGKKNIVVRN
jgi:hypothetical protein